MATCPGLVGQRRTDKAGRAFVLALMGRARMKENRAWSQGKHFHGLQDISFLYPNIKHSRVCTQAALLIFRACSLQLPLLGHGMPRRRFQSGSGYLRKPPKQQPMFPHTLPSVVYGVISSSTWAINFLAVCHRCYRLMPVRAWAAQASQQGHQPGPARVAPSTSPQARNTKRCCFSSPCFLPHKGRSLVAHHVPEGTQSLRNVGWELAQSHSSYSITG